MNPEPTEDEISEANEIAWRSQVAKALADAPPDWNPLLTPAEVDELARLWEIRHPKDKGTPHEL